MIRRRRNSCVYTGKVGARMKPPKPRANRRIIKQAIRLMGGPLSGETVRLDVHSGRFTLPLAPMKGHSAGHYAGPHWVPAHSQPGLTA